MTDRLWPWLNLAAACALLIAALGARRSVTATVRGTTLTAPLRWGIAALCGWTAVQFLAVPFVGVDAGTRSRLGYLALTLLLAPFVSVLGAKRPGARVWNAFVVLPMLAVLNWPAWAGVMTGGASDVLNLDGPALLGSLVVLVMILGNYFGTAYTLSAVLVAVAVFTGLTEYSQSLPTLGAAPFVPRISVSLLCLTALFLARRRRGTVALREPHERLWIEFRDSFGILWTKRLIDRLNQTGVQEGWCVRIDLDGFHWDESADDAQRRESLAKFDQTFRWLLRRFADDAWIDARLASWTGTD